MNQTRRFWKKWVLTSIMVMMIIFAGASITYSMTQDESKRKIVYEEIPSKKEKLALEIFEIEAFLLLICVHCFFYFLGRMHNGV